ncbi:glycerol-3-phosphate dehydrogenase/oxidase [Flaviflexus huanghaiensis]|uniref:glycerol-3-phosphate dehydrogenase/oxidase n=1 Tax=Flaviflexus huanghaiensis TaxID=1111473 RepID=UPI0015FC5C9B|nr:glycerol-3-phosphate dehydrogenase/oxidase [Flaviflexus huanghaiensis]
MRRTGIDEAARETFDVIVIGGGITGVSTAREAALRGLSVLLIEKTDFAAGTSSKSSKLVHGGLRYLQTYQFHLVAESLREREKLVKTAPHLVTMRPFLYLVYEGDEYGMRMLNLALTFYDVASGEWRKRRHTMLSKEEVIALEPHVQREGLLGAGKYYDALTDDARLTIDTAKSACEYGAQLINHADVTGLIIENGQARGVTVRDALTGESAQIHGRQVMSAAGHWTDSIRHLEGDDAARIRPSKGVHIVVKKKDFPLNTAIFLTSPDDGRTVWPIPSLNDDLVYIGTTDADYTGDLNDVRPEPEEIQYLLNVANKAIPSAHLTTDHVVGAWAGLRPLVAPAPGESVGNTSREHAIAEGPTGMLTISGGKLTSSRLMAKQFVDRAVKKNRFKVAKSTSKLVPISGANMRQAEATRRSAIRYGVPEGIAAAWVHRYGSNSEKVFSIWRAEADSRDVVGPRGLTTAEVRYGVREEMCLTLEDLLIRRTSLFFWDEEGGLGGVDRIAGVMAGELEWNEERKAAEIERYRSTVTAHRFH